MRQLAVSVVAVGMVVSACTVESEKSTSSTNGNSGGVITSTELFEVFVKTCLTHFPDGKATKAAFNRAGLQTIPRDEAYYEAFGDELGSFEKVSQRVTGGFGPIIYEVAEGYDGPLRIAHCSVQAEIADPNRDWGPLIASLPARFPSLNWTSGSALQASFDRDGVVFDVGVEPRARGYTWEGATPRCGEGDCGDWEEAVLTIGLTK